VGCYTVSLMDAMSGLFGIDPIFALITDLFLDRLEVPRAY